MKKSLGSLILRRREKLGITQDQLATRSGLSLSFVCNIENDRRMPSFKNVERIATALDLELSFVPKEGGRG